MKPKGSQFDGMSDAMWANDAANPNRIQAQAKATHWEGEKMTEADKAEGRENMRKAGIQDNTYGVTLSDGWGPWLTNEEKSV